MSKFVFHVDPPCVADSGDELAIQTRFRSRMKMLAPTVRLVATPNAGKRTAWAAMKAKQEGMSKGFPDLAAYWANGRGDNAIPGTAYLEFKAKGGALSVEQVDWMNWLHMSGFPCGVFNSVNSAVEFLRRAGAPFSMAAAA